MKSLFPEMEKEIREDRLAERREKVQRARDYLRNRDVSWLINRLLEKGPANEHVLMQEIYDEEYDIEKAWPRVSDLLRDLLALWIVKKLWRKEIGIHPGSGEMSYQWGIRRVHSPNGQADSPRAGKE